MTIITKKLSDLDSAGTLGGSELFEVTQSSASKKLGLTALKDYMEANISVSSSTSSFSQGVTITEGSTSGASASAHADGLVIQSNGNSGISILTADDKTPQIRMGHASDAGGLVAYLQYNGGDQILKCICDNVEFTGNVDIDGILNLNNLKIEESDSGVSQFSGDADGVTIEAATNTGLHIVTGDSYFPQIRLGHASQASGLIMFLSYNGGNEILNWWVNKTEMNGDLDVEGSLSCGDISIDTADTFTPTIKGSGTAGSNTYTTQVGRYNIVGDNVFVEIKVTLTGGIDATTAGEVRIAGLPEAVAAGFDAPLAVGAYANGSLTADHVMAAAVVAGTSEVRLLMQGAASSATLDKTNIGTDFSVTLTGVYRK